MTTTVAIVAVVVVAAVVVSSLLQRRRPDPPTAPRMAVPQQVDRGDFADADQPWIIIVFGSSTCASCRDTWDVIGRIDLPGVSVQRLDFPAERAIHERYRIDSVPTTIVADAEGVVRWSTVGTPAARDVGDALEDLGIVPGDDGTAISFG